MPAGVEPLIRSFGDRRLDLDFDVCTSHRSAVRKLLASPYQMIISDVHLAELDDFLLLKRTQTLEGFVPLVITATTGDKESARRVLEEGAFDLITTPLEHDQTVDTIRLALWHNKFKSLIASQNKMLERYQHIADYPGNRRGEAFRTILKSIEQMVCFVDFADNVEEQVREQAVRRLDTLSR